MFLISFALCFASVDNYFSLHGSHSGVCHHFLTHGCQVPIHLEDIKVYLKPRPVLANDHGYRSTVYGPFCPAFLLTQPAFVPSSPAP